MRGWTRACLTLGAIAWLVGVGAGAARADRLSEGDQKIANELGALREVDNLTFHFDSKELSEADVDKAIEANRGYYAQVKKTLGLEPPERVHVFLYADAAQMRKATGRPEQVAAYSSGHSVHEPWDYDDCHEFVHVFAQHLPKDEDSTPPEGFFVEGLATAIQAQDQGVPMSTWCAVYARYGRAPSLVTLRRDWPKGVASGVHPYHLAGSFHEYLIEKHGIAKVKRYYTHCLEAHQAFGKSFAELERAWREWIAARKVPAEHEEHVLRAMGVTEEQRLPVQWREPKGRVLFDGRSMANWKPEGDGVWSVKDGLLVGDNPASWVRITHEKEVADAVGIRVRFRMTRGDAFQLRTHMTPAGGANEAICAAWATYICRGSAEGTAGVTAQGRSTFVVGAWHEAVLAVEDGRARLWMDGLLAAEAATGHPSPDGAVGLAIEKGRVEIARVETLPACWKPILV